MTEDEALAAVHAAGFTADDIDDLVRARARREREQALAAAEALRNVHLIAGAGDEVPEAARWGKGPRLTGTDDLGAYRAIAASIAKWEHQAEHVDVDGIRSAAIHGMARREAEGKHQDNIDLIEGARR